MSLRDWMNQNSMIMVAVAGGLLLLAAVFVAVRGFGGGPARTIATQAWFYDTGSGKLFTAGRDQVPPIAAPSDSSGQASGVRARIYSCTGCDGGPMDELDYFERYTPAAKAAAEELRTLPIEGGGGSRKRQELAAKMNQGLEVASKADPTTWVPADSPAGRQVSAASASACPGGGAPTECLPD